MIIAQYLRIDPLYSHKPFGIDIMNSFHYIDFRVSLYFHCENRPMAYYMISLGLCHTGVTNKCFSHIFFLNSAK